MKALIFHNHNRKLLTLGAPWDYRLISLAIWIFLEHYMAIIITTNESNYFILHLNFKGTELGMIRMSTILGLGMLRQKDQEFKVNLS